MPDAFDAEVLSDAAEILGFEKAATPRTIIYTPTGGAPTVVAAVVDLLTTEKDGVREDRRAIVQLLTPDAATPDMRDRFEIDTTNFQVETIAAKEFLVVFHLVEIKQHQAGGSTAGVKP